MIVGDAHRRVIRDQASGKRLGDGGEAWRQRLRQRRRPRVQQGPHKQGVKWPEILSSRYDCTRVQQQQTKKQMQSRNAEPCAQ